MGGPPSEVAGRTSMAELFRSARVLVVDDEPRNVVLLERMLRAAGVGEVCGLTDSRSVRERRESWDPDLILLDLHMPHMDGVAVLNSFPAGALAGSFLPVLILSADMTSEAKRQALAAGAHDFVSKPFDQSELLLRVRNLLETRALYVRLQQHHARETALERDRALRQLSDADARLERERRHLREAQTIGRVGSYELDLTTDTVTWSDALYELYGIERDGPHDHLPSYLHMVHPDDRQAFADRLKACADTGLRSQHRYRWTRPNDGGLRWFDGRDERFTGPVGYRIAGTVADVTELVRAQRSMADSEERFRLAFDTAPIGMAMLDLSDQLRFLRVNPAMGSFTGRGLDELLLLDFDTVSDPADLDANRLMSTRLRDDPSGVIHGEKRFRRPGGSIVWGQMALSRVSPSDGAPAYALCLLEDITARKHAETALLHQSLHDPLTDLANRTLLYDRIEHALAMTTRSHGAVGLLYIDLDEFKSVNDSAGHASGDELLIQVAQRLRRAVRPADTVSRIGGDEFAVVCVEVGDLDNLGRVADRILGVLRAPFTLTNAGVHHISASIGLALSDPSTGGPEQLLTNADAAMYVAKQRGRDRFALPQIDQSARSARSARLLPELATALSDDQLIMFAQPVVDLATGATTAAETLIRWRHPLRGVLAPGEFLEVAEHSPLMLAIGRRVLHESLRIAGTWDALPGTRAPDVHVNVSGRQLESGSLIDDVVSALDAFAFPADRLVLELTETHMPTITDSLRGDLNRLREWGVRIAIDDLGTGHSSLTRITELPVDILKIDLKFTAGIGTDPACDAVVRAVLGLGEAMGLDVVAEGVETVEQADLLRTYGCRTAQGYLYSRPLPEEELQRYLTEHTLTSLGGPASGPAGG